MKMNICPSCKEKTVSLWQNFNATRLNPATCKACQSEIYIPVKYGFKAILWVSPFWLAALGGVYIVKNGWPLLSAIPLVAMLLVIYLKYPLVVHPKQ
jgi:hypothetical protein